MTQDLKDKIHELHDFLLTIVDEDEGFAVVASDFGIDNETDWNIACDIVSEALMSVDGIKKLDSHFGYWWNEEENEGYIEVDYGNE